MSQWPSSKARQVLAALIRIGWHIKRQSGSHKTLARECTRSSNSGLLDSPRAARAGGG